MRFRYACGILGGTWLCGVAGTVVRARFDSDLSDHFILLGVYAACASVVWSIDRLRLREFVMRHDLDRANAELRKADEVRRRLFVNISHDFRTPLALIHAEAEALERETSAPARSVALTRVRKQTSALAELTNELLELARLEAGKTPRAPVDFAIREALVETAAQMAASGRAPIVVVPGDEPGAVRADLGHVRRILVNLVANAVRHAGAGAGPSLRRA